MSRIGNLPIPIPNGVSVKINKNQVTVKGPKGELSNSFNPDITIRQENSELLVERPTDLRHHRAMHGLTRALVNNMVVGVSEGFTKELHINGVGYRAELQENNLVLHVGYSHPVLFEPSPTISFDVPKDRRGTVLFVQGIRKDEVGQIAAEIRKKRPPEPYKGKGIKYADEIIRRKAGKSGKTS